MKYIVIPAELLDKISQETLDHLYMSPRYSNDRSKIIMKLDNYDKLFLPNMILSDVESVDNGIDYPYPIYISGSHEFNELMKSDDWRADIN
mgnify:CR=1 FL=1